MREAWSVMRRAFRYSLLLVVVLGAFCVLLLAATVYTYDRLTAETLIAELRFDETGERQYVAYLRTGDRCDERTYPVFGDQWRVDAEFLKWKYWALLLGLDSQYRLDRLEGRYRSAAEQNTAPNVAHDLAERTAVDVVAVAGALGSFNFLLDATYGTSTNYKTVYSNTSSPANVNGLKLNNVTGYGILLIDGDLVLGGGFTWYGPIVVTGSVTLNGGGGGINVRGQILSGTSTLTDVTINGGNVINYNSCEIKKAFATQPLVVLNWKQNLY